MYSRQLMLISVLATVVVKCTVCVSLWMFLLILKHTTKVSGRIFEIQMASTAAWKLVFYLRQLLQQISARVVRVSQFRLGSLNKTSYADSLEDVIPDRRQLVVGAKVEEIPLR